MEAEKTEKKITGEEDDESKIIYRGWKVMPFIIGTNWSISLKLFLTYIINIETKQDYKVYCNLTN